MREHEILAKLGSALGPSSDRVLVGIGDDAAVLSQSGAKLVITDDACVEGVHFTRAIASFEDVGYRATMAAASDVAAMGAKPLAAVASVTLRRGDEDAALQEIFAGQALAARNIGAPIVGGNLSRGDGIAITTTWLGEADVPVLRSGARAGDRVWVAGPLGLAAAGLAALLAGRDVSASPLREAALAWRRPEARISTGLAIASLATSLIDVSDGLSADALHVAIASNVALHLDVDAIVACGGALLEDAAAALSLDAASLALGGGEDYALVATSRHDLSTYGLRAIGDVRDGAAAVTLTRRGRPYEAPAHAMKPFDHFG
jgi:thiamine-monophosphate kinase